MKFAVPVIPFAVSVTPAEAGVQRASFGEPRQEEPRLWIPAFAGMTQKTTTPLRDVRWWAHPTLQRFQILEDGGFFFCGEFIGEEMAGGAFTGETRVEIRAAVGRGF